MQVRTLKKDGRRPQRYGCSKGYVCTLEKEGMEMKTALKRSMAMLLAIVMALSTVTFTWAEPTAQAEPTKTLGQLLAENYADKLTDEEKDLLTAGLLSEDSYTYTAPDKDNGGDLVRIDAESKTVTAKAYTNNGYTWVPVSAQLMVNDQAQGASFGLTKGEGGSYSGSFS